MQINLMKWIIYFSELKNKWEYMVIYHPTYMPPKPVPKKDIFFEEQLCMMELKERNDKIRKVVRRVKR